MFTGTGVSLLAAGLLMLLYVKVGKFRHRDRMLALVTWKGDEQVLDIGTGRGLLLIGAAKRLTSGRAVGIDIWNASDLSGNSEERTTQNVVLEGVAEKIELRSEDAREMHFTDASFDVVVSNLCLHNIGTKRGNGAGVPRDYAGFEAWRCRIDLRFSKSRGLCLSLSGVRSASKVGVAVRV